VIRFVDIKKRLEKQYDDDYAYLQKNYDEQDKLRDAVRRYHDLEREARVREERGARIIAALGEEKFNDLDVTRRGAAKEIFFPSENVPLWGVMRAIVEQVSEIQVVDLQSALEYFKRKVSRQAIESALASHKETFEIKTRNRDKFVSLKR
jgi:hypothetical protein